MTIAGVEERLCLRRVEATGPVIFCYSVQIMRCMMKENFCQGKRNRVPVCQDKYIELTLRPAFRIFLVPLLFIAELFCEAAFAAAMHDGAAAILTKVFGNISAVDHKAGQYNSLAECHGQKSQQ